MGTLTVTNLAIARAPRHDIDFTVPQGNVLAILGASGSGKSTLLSTIVGALPAEAGSIAVDGVDVTRLPTYRRNIGIVFQEPLLFTHLDVARNIGYGLRNDQARIDELLRWLDIEGLRSRPVTQLSGGQAQRVALARALAPRPSVLLLDEPLSALDRDLRQRLAEDLRAIVHEEGIATVHVTHDEDEAHLIADQVVNIATLGIAG